MCREGSCESSWCHLVLITPAWASGKESTYVHIFGALHDSEDLICHGLDPGASNLVRLGQSLGAVQLLVCASLDPCDMNP